MRKSTSINLELIKGEDGGVKFYAKQFDDLKLNIKVYDGLEEVNVDGQDIIVCIIKEDKTVIEQTKDITVEDNTIVARLSKQATTALGKCSMEVLLRDEEGTASTTTISYMVSEKLSASIVEMIKREDDINALNLIEEFIETSNVDMLDIKEAIKDLKATVDGAQDNIDTEYETILEALRALEGTIIENIEGKANEALTIADEAVEKVTEALNNADEVLVKVEEAKGAVGEITTEKDNALQAIESIKTGATNEIDTVKGRAINDIDEARTDSLETIRNNGNGVANDLNSLSDTLKADITNTGLLETNKVVRAREEAINTIDDLKDNVLGSLGEEALKVEELLNATVTEIKEQAETDLNACKDEVIGEAIRDKEEAITELNDAMRALNDLKANILSEANNDIGAIKVEAINNIGTIKDNANNELNENKAGAINELNEVKAGALVEIDTLKTEVDNILTSIDEKIVKSNGNIEELTGLIEEAREVAGLVRAFIDSKAVDLSNYYTKEETENLIDEKIGLIEIPEVDLNGYYTKNEVNELLKDKVGAVEDEAVQTIFIDIPDFISSPPPEINFEPVKTLFFSKQAGIIHALCYFKKEVGNNIVLDANNYIYFNNITNNDVVIYYWDTRYNKWITSGNISNVTGNATSSDKVIGFYYHDFDIYSKNDTAKIVRKNIKYDTANDVNDFNLATNLKKYKVVQTANILNSPVEGTFKGMLIVDKIDAVDAIISQELIVEGNTSYKRVFMNNEWTEWQESGGAVEVDLSSYSTTEEVRSLINESIGVVRASLIGDINDIIGGI